MRSYKSLLAPVSVILLIVVAGLSFLNLRPAYVGPPPILDPNFELWVGDQGSRRLMLWDLEYVSGLGDNVSLRETVFAGKRAVEFLIMQSGGDGNPVYAYLKQTIDGERLAGLLSYDVGVWVLAEPCGCDGTTTARSVIFGVDVNDGIHTLTFIFSDIGIETRTILAHRFVYIPTQPGTWTYQHINVTEQFKLAQWSPPERVTFSLVFEVGGYATGLHSAYVNSFQWAKPQLNAGSHISSQVSQSGFSLNEVYCFDLGLFSFPHSLVKL